MNDWPEDWRDISVERAEKYVEEHFDGGGDEDILERCLTRLDAAKIQVRSRTGMQPPVERGAKRPD